MPSPHRAALALSTPSAASPTPLTAVFWPICIQQQRDWLMGIRSDLPVSVATARAIVDGVLAKALHYLNAEARDTLLEGYGDTGRTGRRCRISITFISRSNSGVG